MSNYRKVTVRTGISYAIGDRLKENERGVPTVVEISLLGADYMPNYWVIGVYVTYDDKVHYPFITIPYHAVELLFIQGE